ncbi:glutathione hydrolase 7 [Oncorhynchus mykiss]|uniref:Glutathione hydrolase n=1 Tax=Oncorhynchus mykiss TaxID=8022 RepID=A0A8C7TKT3_ONCMY|nr:glutathione hydrolase 7 [Oncorhynchus keta]XP_035612357.1 glutathione hydrolase 7 [Oncorhynchus keta]XP_035612358.1 glutathione hydrolase 7 [Oncorhynchus keta]XP_035612359.1 glutathione hydrolase 7 [Oncorhynchus keta]XP_036803437.1 glutathione hydrolase 7 [Oncorhynchus mykiss]XP_036803438.1 glutathione hydrolase 7 [Oncorhynchus mykiss]
MYNPANDAVAGYSSGTMTEKDPSLETTLGSAYSPVDYMSITSFPRLPEDDVVSGENTLKSRKDDDNFLSEQDTDPDLFLKSARLQRLPSSASDLASHDITPLRETTRDPLAEGCACQRDGLTVIITACLTFATGVTIALIMQIYFGDPQIFNQGAVVTDVAQCTSLGFEALEKQGSSVDAAIAAALCLGIIHPHTSGIGGGGVMLVHDIRRNESRVIDFSETAPSAILEDMLQTNLELKPGLMVGVPGMLSGMHQAHQLYGRMPWKDVVTMAADVARSGFNVTHDLAEALAKVKDKNVSEAFRALFLPNGQPPLSGLFSRRPDLAAILDAVAANGIAEFYSGNLTQEMAAAVQARGGVLSEEDFGNYTTVLQQPAESFYQGHHVMAAPAPSAGAALITALNILEGYNITSQVPRNSTYHWIAESLKIAVALASGLGDPMYDSSISDMVTQMLSKSQAVLLRQMINDSQAFPPGHYTPSYALEEGAVASQVMVMGPDDFIVSVMSSLNRPFGSRIVTPSGILLNSQILDFSWSNKTQTSQPPNPHNVIQPGKRPLSFLVPTAVRPRLGLCGTYVALGSSNGDRALSGITQVLMNVLSSRKNLSDSLAYGRLHPQLQPDTLLVDSEFLEEDVEVLQFKGHQVQRVDVLSLVEGTRRTNDLIIGVKDPRSADASALTMSMNMP